MMNLIKLKALNIKKQDALMAIIRFFALMLIITIVARALNATVTPTAATTRAYSALITKSVSTNAVLTAYGGEAMLLPQGILIKRVYKAAGEQIKQNDCLATLALPELESAAAMKTAQLNKLNVQLKLLQKSRPADDFALKQAQQRLDEAYNAHKKAYESGDENAIEAGRITAQAAEDARNAALHSFEREQQAASEQAAQNKAGAGILKVEIDTAKAELALLNTLIEAEGQVLAPFDGIITKSTLTAGEESQKTAVFIAKQDDGILAKGIVYADNANELSAGMRVTLVQGKESDSAVILSADIQPDGGYAFEAMLNGTHLKPGSASAEIVISQTQYPLCVPAQSIRQDINGSFVYLLQTRQTVLGEASVLVRAEVKVLDSDGNIAAIEGAIGSSDSIVKSADRPLTNGARVKTE